MQTMAYFITKTKGDSIFIHYNDKTYHPIILKVFIGTLKKPQTLKSLPFHLKLKSKDLEKNTCRKLY
jgi:hypothetical protein